MIKHKIAPTSFESSIAQIESQQTSSLYFLIGDDQYLHQFFIKKVLFESSRKNPVEKIILTPEEMGSKSVIDQLIAIDLFNTKKLFILYEPSRLKGKSRDELLLYCRKPSNNNILILVQNEFGVKNIMMEDLSILVSPISSSTPFENEMKKWAKIIFKENGYKNVSSNIIDKITEIGGDSLFHLKNEIDKISITVNSEEELNKIDITAYSGWKRKFKSYQFFDSLGNKDLKSSMKLGMALVNHDTSMISLIRPLTEFFQELLYAKIFNGTKSHRSGYSTLSPSIKRQLGQYAIKYHSKEIVLALRRLNNIDKKLKTSRLNDESAITEFVFATLYAE